MEAEWGEETSESGGPIAPRVADLKGSGLGNGDAILIGDGACQAVQGCLGFVSPRKGCQEPRKTGGMSPWPCLSAGGREECWERRPPVPLTLRSTLCQSTASLLGHTPTTRQTEWHSEQDGENECNLSGWIKLYDAVQLYGMILCTWKEVTDYFWTPDADTWETQCTKREENKPLKTRNKSAFIILH